MGKLKAGKFGRTGVELASSRLVRPNCGRTGSILANWGNLQKRSKTYEIQIAPYEQI